MNEQKMPAADSALAQLVDFKDGVSLIPFLPPDTPLFYGDLQHLHGDCSRDSILRAVKAGDLPQPGRFMGRAAWTAGGISAWIAGRIRKTQQELQDALKG